MDIGIELQKGSLVCAAPTNVDCRYGLTLNDIRHHFLLWHFVNPATTSYQGLCVCIVDMSGTVFESSWAIYQQNNSGNNLEVNVRKGGLEYP